MNDIKALAESVVSYIISDDVDSLKLIVTTTGDVESWRDVFRYELDIESLIQVGELLQYDIVVPKLILWGTQIITGFHLAALRGADDVIRLGVEYLRVSVDIRMQNGATALHMACFAGQLDTVKFLIDELHADVKTVDDYGWTVMHYAAVEGQFSVAEHLLTQPIDIFARDQDGASAAFRAHVAGHDDFVCLLGSMFGEMDELLNIAEDEYAEISPPHETAGNGQQGAEPIYAVVNRSNKTTQEFRSSGAAPVKLSNSFGPPSSKPTAAHVRRMISEQLAAILDGGAEEESAYEIPVQHESTPESDSNDDTGIGYRTLTRVVREELVRYKQAAITKITATGNIQSRGVKSTTRSRQYNPSGQYEEIIVNASPDTTNQTTSLSSDYDFIPEPSLPPPPVPPQARSANRPTSASRDRSSRGLNNSLAVDNPMLFQTLKRIEETTAIMQLSFTVLVRDGLKHADDWKRLGRTLPVCSGSADKVEKKLKTIEKAHPGDRRQQATTMLKQWRKWCGQKANVELLIQALYKCGLTHDAALLQDKLTESSV